MRHNAAALCHNESMDNLFSINTAATRLDCHPETLRRIIRRGELAAVKVGKHWRVRETDLDAFLNARTVPVKDVSAL
jgi:excisionase family DNA binding protein